MILSPGYDTNSSRMCGVLLHVEKVGALWLLCAAESVWEEKVQQLSRCNVSGGGKLMIETLCFVWPKVKVSLFVCGQWPDGQTGGWSGGPGGGQFLLGVFRSRWRRKAGDHHRPATQPAQLHHCQRPHGSVKGLSFVVMEGKNLVMTNDRWTLLIVNGLSHLLQLWVTA